MIALLYIGTYFLIGLVITMLTVVWAVIGVLLIVVKYTAEPFDNYLKRKR